MSESKNKMKVTGIFPTPLYLCKLDREFTDRELDFVQKNKTSDIRNTYVLNNKVFSALKKELEVIINDYFEKIIVPADDVTPYITQSWLNYLQFHKGHHQHFHLNSIVSGVLYMKANRNVDAICFHKNENSGIKIYSRKYNMFNAQDMTCPVETGELILFPSHIQQSVNVKQDSDERISLAFNVFVKGKIGDVQSLTELNLD